jgi:adenylate cyclase class IV
MHAYEIEIKVLLGDQLARDTFMEAVQVNFPAVSHSYTESQKNHYFEWGDLAKLGEIFASHLSHEEIVGLADIREKAKSFSVRTRGTQDETILVVKATVNDETSSNGTARIEWEVDLHPMSLEQMDELVLQSGFIYQAKWSRDRDEYQLDHSTALCIDRNAGYGYLAEFERVIDNPEKIEETRTDLLQMIEFLGYKELDQARLARMFDFYNQNWREYYGTEKVFVVE